MATGRRNSRSLFAFLVLRLPYRFRLNFPLAWLRSVCYPSACRRREVGKIGRFVQYCNYLGRCLVRFGEGGRHADDDDVPSLVLEDQIIVERVPFKC